MRGGVTLTEPYRRKYIDTARTGRFTAASCSRPFGEAFERGTVETSARGNVLVSAFEPPKRRPDVRAEPLRRP